MCGHVTSPGATVSYLRPANSAHWLLFFDVARVTVCNVHCRKCPFARSTWIGFLLGMQINVVLKHAWKTESFIANFTGVLVVCACVLKACSAANQRTTRQVRCCIVNVKPCFFHFSNVFFRIEIYCFVCGGVRYILSLWWIYNCLFFLSLLFCFFFVVF